MTVRRLLTVGAVALVLTHWLRLLPLGVRAPGATRWEDFLDLLTPYVVAGPALAVLARVGASRRDWVLGLLGTGLFVQGHGLHLSANSIAYATGDAAPAHLWDEVVGHHLWFTGLALLVGVLLHASRDLALRPGASGTGLAALVALTWAANVIEGGSVPLGVVLAVGLAGLGLRQGGPAGRLTAGACGLSLLLVASYGLAQGGFPQPSELGWL